MLEPLVRSNLQHWLQLYDRLPSPARNLATSIRGWLLSRIRYAPPTFAILDGLRDHESWSPAEIAGYQLPAAQKTLDRARQTVPFYSSYPALRLRTLEDLRSLPILHREVVRSNQEQFVSRALRQRDLIRAGTTGTTGSNLRVAYTEEVLRHNWAFLLRQWSWAGVSPREPRVTLYGSRIVPANRTTPPYWAVNLSEHQVLLSIFHLSEKTASTYLQFLRRQQGKILEGFPSVLGILADFLLRRGATIPMRVVFTSGEPLYASVRRKIEQAFRTHIFDSYGMTEFCGLIQQCERGAMHLIPDYGLLEILDDRGEAAREGQEGNLVWTGFINPAMPLIRYQIGDRGISLATTQCSCGRSFPVVVPTITRESDILRCPDGRLFSPRALNQLLKESSALRFCQFVHDRRERVVVRAVAGNGHALEDLMRIRGQLQELLGPQITVTAGLASEPIAGPGGKIALILNRVEQ